MGRNQGWWLAHTGDSSTGDGVSLILELERQTHWLLNEDRSGCIGVVWRSVGIVPLVVEVGHLRKPQFLLEINNGFLTSSMDWAS